MQETAFRAWLQSQGYNSGTVNSRVSNCLRVCDCEGDIDSHYCADKCKTLLERLTYSTDDERHGRSPLHAVPINGNIRNGTATLKQAVGLYNKFCEDRDIYVRPKLLIPVVAEATPELNAQKAAPVAPIDSYAQFLDYFGIGKDAFYSFGLDNTIFAKTDYAIHQWSLLKKQLLENQPLTIRGYGRQGKHTDLFFKLYEYIFSNHNIKEDGTNNAVPRRNIQSATGYRINDSLLNYQCSHIFGHTKNPLLFEAVWNICFTPKIFDPLTGHEAKGPWSEEYKKLFAALAVQHFNLCIKDYNAFISEHDILNRILTFVQSLHGKYDDRLLRNFQNDAISEWQPICEETEP